MTEGALFSVGGRSPPPTTRLRRCPRWLIIKHHLTELLQLFTHRFYFPFTPSPKEIFMYKYLLIATALLAFAGISSAADTPVMNKMCPMCDKEVPKSNAPTVDITVGEGAECKHMKMAMCSEKCSDEFKKDPVKGLSNHFQKPGSGTQFKP
jgi:hypothetical protein